MFCYVILVSRSDCLCFVVPNFCCECSFQISLLDFFCGMVHYLILYFHISGNTKAFQEYPNYVTGLYLYLGSAETESMLFQVFLVFLHREV